MNNGIDWFIPCAMNANRISPKANPRLNRIKTVSRIVRYVILGILVLSFVFFLLLSFPTWRLGVIEQHPVWSMLVSLPQFVLWVWYWKLAKLFYYYERGLIFATETIRCIKMLGVICVLSWLFFNIQYFISDHHAAPQPIAASPFRTVSAPVEMFRIGFFNFSIHGINIGQLLAGIIIVVIAWIMDEGRKIQEEQELTV